MRYQLMTGLLQELKASFSDVGDTSVIASFQHPRLALESPSDLRIFIPDLHLLSSAARGFNGFSGPAPSHALLRAVLERLATMRGVHRQADPSAAFRVYFMGDALDLWREGRPGSDVQTLVAGIAAEHRELLELACSPELDAHFLLGNHDFELYRAGRFSKADRRHYFPETAPGAVALHGDVFDWIEQFPDLFNEAVVYYLDSAYNHLDDIYDAIKDKLRSVSAPAVPASAGAAAAAAAASGATGAILPCSELQDARGLHRLFGRAWDACERARASCAIDLRCVVIGHTHGAGIVAYENGADFLTLVDAGGWIQDAHDSHGSRESGTIAAMCGDEVWIYRVSEG